MSRQTLQTSVKYSRLSVACASHPLLLSYRAEKSYRRSARPRNWKWQKSISQGGRGFVFSRSEIGFKQHSHFYSFRGGGQHECFHGPGEPGHDLFITRNPPPPATAGCSMTSQQDRSRPPPCTGKINFRKVMSRALFHRTTFGFTAGKAQSFSITRRYKSIAKHPDERLRRKMPGAVMAGRSHDRGW